MAIPSESFYTSRALGVGEIAEYNPKTLIRSMAAEEDDIKFGRAVMAGTTDETEVKIFAGASGVFKGVATFSTQASDLDNSQYKQYDPVGVCDQGVIMVYVEEAVTPASPVRIRHTATTGKVPGSFCTTADPNRTVLLTGANYRSTAASGTAAKLYLDAPFAVTADT